MNQNEKFNNVLNECLDRILKGATVESCLHDHPEQKAELEPLLKTALAARVASTIQPRPEFKVRARSEFQAALRDMEARKKRRRFSFNFDWRPQLRLQTGWAIGVVASLVVVLGGGGTVAASSVSMPDSTLYSVKLATEKAQLAVTPSEVGKAELNAKFADRRTEEMEYLVAKGDAQEVQNTAILMTTNLSNMTALTGDGNLEDTVLAQGGDRAFGSNATAPEANNQPAMLGVASAPAVLATPVPAAAPPLKSGAPETPVESVDASAAQNVPAASVAVENTPSQENTKNLTQDNSTRNASTTNKLSSEDREKIKKIIEKNYQDRKVRLEALLEKASSKFRPAIRQAIAKSEAEYFKAIRNLEISANLDK